MPPAAGWDRDPFAPGFDGALWWESPERARIRKRILVALGSGYPVWITGAAGSGRSALVERVASDVWVRGRPVLFARGDCPQTADACLDRWLSAVGEPSGGAGLVARSVRFYGRLLERFTTAGPVTVIPSTEPLSGGALDECCILAGLVVAGSPVSVPLIIGPGPGSGRDWTEIAWPLPSPDDLSAMVFHRLSACGVSTGVGQSVVDAVTGASGFAEAISAARDAFDRLRFDRLAGRSGGSAPPLAEPVLDPVQIDEVGGLLADLEEGS